MSNSLPACLNAAIFPGLEPSLRRLLSNVVEPQPFANSYLTYSHPSPKTEVNLKIHQQSVN
ncbi:hypothetical protein IQ249_10475 [Lusitaniella coriacea LEGE 07157]|uniref:Uncharacterized protein n=1 Tax=Lusitaniella coriacea LEGE 07157 TaxID=945747 RepID=A0A8J7DWG2_9CYAN|nr:hypothetical protein [Lusitaniella coriacea]MBE9116322.1 hypothetical protein [Lusitaniella coriacea LEGE 07157]